MMSKIELKNALHDWSKNLNENILKSHIVGYLDPNMFGVA